MAHGRRRRHRQLLGAPEEMQSEGMGLVLAGARVSRSFYYKLGGQFQRYRADGLHPPPANVPRTWREALRTRLTTLVDLT